ncbi:MAG: cysteine desulfurase family protein [Verrucomicrobiales bacterium]
MIYFDNNATTQVAPEVVEEMLPYFSEFYGNPSAGYRFARESRKAIDLARERIAALIGADPGEIVFTSCGTESNNAAIASALRVFPERKHLVVSAVEHSAILKYCASLEEDGYETTVLPVDAGGRVDVAGLRDAIRPDETALVSLMWANNETGVISPVAEAAAAASETGVLFHTDAVNAMGKVPIDAPASGVHFMSLSGHKFHAPKGVGALFIRSGVRFRPLLIGGGQEDQRRAGTEAVAQLAGLGKAAELARVALRDWQSVGRLRDAFEKKLLAAVPGVDLNGSLVHRLPNTTHASFDGVDAGDLLVLMDQAELCCSSGSACSTGAVKPSHVMVAMGHSEARAKSSLRFSLSRYNTAAEVDSAVAIVGQAVAKLRDLKPSGSNRVVRSGGEK